MKYLGKPIFTGFHIPLSVSEISMFIQIIIVLFDSVEIPYTWNYSITTSSVIFPEDSFLYERFHHENEPGCPGSGRYFSRPYFLNFN